MMLVRSDGHSGAASLILEQLEHKRFVDDVIEE